MKLELNEKYLITTDGWFYAPNGEMHNAVFGTVRAISNDQETLGIKTNRGSTNWYVVIGSMIIAGCQMHYAVKCDNVNYEPPTREMEHDGKLNTCPQSSTRIYNADDPNPLRKA